MATHFSILAWKIPWTEGYSPWGRKQSDMTEPLTLSRDKGMFESPAYYGYTVGN